MNLGRQIRQTSKRGRLFSATVIESLGNRASVRLAGNGAMVHNLNVVGGPVVAGSRVNVDYSTEPPTILAVGPETMTLDETRDALDQGLLQKPLGGGAGPPSVFVPAMGGNDGGFFANHQDQRVYGGGPWAGGGFIEYDQAGIRFPYPKAGEDGNGGGDNYFFVYYGIWSVPAGVSGFSAEPIYRLKRTSGPTTSDLEIYHVCQDISKVLGAWKRGQNLSAEAVWLLPFTPSLQQWTDMGSASLVLGSGEYYVEDGDNYSYGEIYGTLSPGMIIMFATENYSSFPSLVANGWFLGWNVTLL